MDDACEPIPDKPDEYEAERWTDEAKWAFEEGRYEVAKHFAKSVLKKYPCTEWSRLAGRWLELMQRRQHEVRHRGASDP